HIAFPIRQNAPPLPRNMSPTSSISGIGTNNEEHMPAAIETHSLGESVELNAIGRALKKLWPEDESALTRASLINLAIYSEKSGALERNTQLIARIAENHACRALVIGANRDSKESRVEAWINAHCHVGRAGGK